jgi:hypothetical protein
MKKMITIITQKYPDIVLIPFNFYKVLLNA